MTRNNMSNTIEFRIFSKTNYNFDIFILNFSEKYLKWARNLKYRRYKR